MAGLPFGIDLKADSSASSHLKLDNSEPRPGKRRINQSLMIQRLYLKH